ncbi:MAG: PD-(D/E)XK nuclease domain-containing protein [Deltaproteobacteria bacterium]|nr:PD-(D/E)XK nuclease domain-containing protein [Deltaproteobacteria bacterium]
MDKRNNYFEEAIKREDAEKITEIITSLYLEFPAIHHKSDESFYHGLLYAFFRAIRGIKVTSEPAKAEGTADMVLELENNFYVITELKYQPEKERIRRTAEVKRELNVTLEAEKMAYKGLDAIRNIGYEIPYKRVAKRILKMSVGIYGRGRALVFLENDVQSKIILELGRLKDSARKVFSVMGTLLNEADIIIKDAESLQKKAVKLNRDEALKLNIEVKRLGDELEKLKARRG